MATDPRARLAEELFAALWERYRARVPHVRVYERLVREAGAAFKNDHVAFRTFAWQDPGAGLHAVARPFEALGYVAEACYAFPDKHLSAVHLRHPEPGLPKVFVSELKTWELSPAARKALGRSLARHRAPLPDAALAALRRPEALGASARASLVRRLSERFRRLPWPEPQKRDVLLLDRESQYAAWVLVHGYEVNHFTASIDSHGPGPLEDIEKTVAALRRAGVPMKGEIEGERGSKLRQSATEAAPAEVAVREGTRRARMPWTYAYFELAERPLLADPATGESRRFEGFLGGQATQLFEMTRRR